MARQQIKQYVFYPSGSGYGNIQIPGNYTNATVLTIIDTNKQTFIQNFADPALGATFTWSGAGPTGINSNFPNAVDGYTTITLTANTHTSLGYASSDKLAIYVESPYQTIKSWPFGTDAVERMRVAQPTSLIDADFEYGLQTTKWQSLFTCLDGPSIYEVPGGDVWNSANVVSYVTTIGNVLFAGSLGANISNQFVNQTSGVIPNVITSGGTLFNNGPQWTGADYALLVNMGGGGYPTTATKQGATATYLTANVTKVHTRQLPVSSTVGYGLGNIVAVAYLPWQNNTTIGPASATVLSVPGSQVWNFNGNIWGGVQVGALVALQTTTANQWELCTILGFPASTAGGANILLQRNVWGTNSANTAIQSGGGLRVIDNIEVVNVDTVDSATQLSVDRTYFNTLGYDQLYAGSVVNIMNIDSLLNSGGNSEIIQMNGITNTRGNVPQFSRGQLGTTSQVPTLGGNPTASAGSILLRLSGMFLAGNANVTMVGTNYTAHPFLTNSSVTNGAVSTFGHYVANTEGQYQIVAQPSSVQSPNYFTYYPRFSPRSLTIGYPLNTYNTILRRAGFFGSGNIPFTSITSNGANPSIITVTTPYPHGLTPAMPVLVNLWTVAAGVHFATGPFTILATPTPTTFTYQGKANGVVAAATNFAGTIYVRPSAYYIHRPIDGGVLIGCGTPSHGAKAERQTKKYFRYQSGKGLMWTSGTLLGTNLDISNIAANSASLSYAQISVTVDQEHFLQTGANVQISGIDQANFNGYFPVYTVTGDYTFTINAKAAIGATIGTFQYQPKAAVAQWAGASVRAGMFDDQNGAFWENTGSQLNVVIRSATWPLAGYVSVEVGSNLVQGDGTTWFTKQYKKFDRVVLRGMTHTIVGILDDNTMYVTPVWRGASNQVRVKASKIIETRIPQSQWNVDRLDGTGPSGYTIIPTLMQMLMIQYTWYGAGFCEFGLRGPRGEMIMAHRQPNNNNNYQAWMRTGNLPARYSASNETPSAFLANAMSATDNYMVITDSMQFPTAQLSASTPVYVNIDNEVVTATGVISYSPMTANGMIPANISIGARAAGFSMWQDGAIKSFSMGSAEVHNAGNAAVVINNTNAPSLNHWGSAVILDGGFDKDQGYAYTYIAANIAFPTAPTGTVGNVVTTFAMRLAPSVSNGLPAKLGEAELVNRAQLILNNIVVNFQGTGLAANTARYLVEGILNPNNINTTTTVWNYLYNSSTSTINNPSGAVQPSFTQFAANTNLTQAGTLTYTSGSFAQGGERLFAIPINFTNSGLLDLSTVKQLGNSGIPGNNIYPDGPEILVINITALSTLSGLTNPVQGDIQISFAESQA
jgi:hypothetical protein